MNDEILADEALEVFSGGRRRQLDEAPRNLQFGLIKDVAGPPGAAPDQFGRAARSTTSATAASAIGKWTIAGWRLGRDVVEASSSFIGLTSF